MIGVIVTIYILFTLTFTNIRVVNATCEIVSACKCNFENGSSIDLSSLANTGGTPRFKDVKASSGSDLFSWNPCNTFSEMLCQNVSACQIHSGSSYSIGIQDSAKFVMDKNRLSLEYTDNIVLALRKTIVTLVCDKDADAILTATGEKPPGSATYRMELKGKEACPVDVSNGLSTGSIMCIILLVLVIVYLAAGIAFQIFVKKSSGTDMCPHYVFWSSLPGLIKDGVFYFASCLKRSQYETK